MLKKTAFTTIALLAVVSSTTSFADSHVDPAIAGAIEARQAHMQLYAHNLGLLGGMAQGEIAYDAAAAQAAADNLMSLAGLDQSRYWPMGSDSESVEGSRALPDLWADMDGVMSAAGDFQMAVEAMAGAAGTDLASLQAAMGDLGQSCGGCHRPYRVRNN